MWLSCSTFAIFQGFGSYTQKSFIKGRQVSQDFLFATFTAPVFNTLSFPKLQTPDYLWCWQSPELGAEVAGQKCKFFAQNKHLHVAGWIAPRILLSALARYGQTAMVNYTLIAPLNIYVCTLSLFLCVLYCFALFCFPFGSHVDFQCNIRMQLRAFRYISRKLLLFNLYKPYFILRNYREIFSNSS